MPIPRDSRLQINIYFDLIEDLRFVIMGVEPGARFVRFHRDHAGFGDSSAVYLARTLAHFSPIPRI